MREQERGKPAGGAGAVAAHSLAHLSWSLPVLVVVAVQLHREAGAPIVDRWAMIGGPIAVGASILAALIAVGLAVPRKRNGALIAALIGLALDMLLACGIAAGLSAEGLRAARAREEATQKVVAQPIIDEDYRFRLAWPGKGWKMLSHDQAARLAPLAVAGAVFEGGKVLGLVAVEKTDRTDLTEEAKAVADAALGDDKVTSPFEPARAGDFPALRFHVELETGGRRVRYDYLVYLREGFAFRVAATTTLAQKGCDGGACAAPMEDQRAAFFAAFTPTEGDVRPRTVKPRESAAGPGYRVSGGTYQSSAHHLVISPKKPLEVVVGRELDAFDPNSVVGLVSPGGHVVITFGVEPVIGVPHDAYTRKMEAAAAARAGATAPAPPAKGRGKRPAPADRDRVRARVGEQEISLRRLSDAAHGREHLYGIVFGGDRALRVDAWYDPGIRVVAEPMVIEGLASVLFPGDVDPALVRDDPEAIGAVDRGYSLRGHVYRDFERGLVYRAPRGTFAIWAGDEAGARSEGAILYAAELSAGVHVALYREAVVDPAALHKAVVDRMFAGEAEGSPAESRWGEATALTSARTFSDGELLQRHELSTTVFEGAAYRLSIWGLAGNLGAASSLVDELRAGLQFPRGGLRVVELGAGLYRDNRFGFTIAPPSGFHFEDQTKPEERGFSTVLRWSEGKEWITVSAAGTNESQVDLDFIADLVEQRVHEVAPETIPEPGTLAGRAGRRLRAPRGKPDFQLITVHRTVFSVAISAPTPRTEAVVRSFAIIE